MIDDTLQRNARAFPLFVFLSRQFLQPHPIHEERFSFSFRLPSGGRLKYTTPFSKLRDKWVALMERAEKRL